MIIAPILLCNFIYGFKSGVSKMYINITQMSASIT